MASLGRESYQGPTDALRAQLRKFGLKVTVGDEGGRTLTKPEMEVIAGHAELHRRSLEGHPLTTQIPSRRVHSFWASPDTSKWQDEVRLQAENQPGLKSMLRFGCEVWLWTYHPGN